jgi:hypothetical protein
MRDCSFGASTGGSAGLIPAGIGRFGARQVKPRREKRGGWKVLALALLVGLPLLYVLSVGPAGLFLPEAAWEAVYAPLIWLCQWWEPLAYVLLWNLRIWGAQAY